MPPELVLILACCRPSDDADRLALIRAAAATGFDPAALIAAARHHRVEGFVEQALKAAVITLPSELAALLADRVRRARFQLLRNTAEEVRATQALHAAGIDVVSLKGASLAMLAQGSLGLKSAWDVDLLVRPETRARADAVLTALGYKPLVLDGRRSPQEIKRYRVGVKEVVWLHPERDTAIELHVALFDQRRHIAGIGLISPRITVDLPGGGRVETLAPGPLFAYLAVHGTQHGWTRLKWLADVAGLLGRHPDAIEAWHHEAIAVGAGRASVITLSLAHRLLGTALPASLTAAIGRDRAIARAVSLSLRLIERSRSDETTGPRADFAQQLTLTRLSLLTEPGSRAPAAALLARLRRPYHPHHLKVPHALLPVLMLGWLPFRLMSRLGRFARRRDQRGGKVASKA